MQRVHLDEEDIGDTNQGWKVVLLLWQLALSHGLKLAVMYSEIRPEIAAVGQRCDECRQCSNSSRAFTCKCKRLAIGSTINYQQHLRARLMAHPGICNTYGFGSKGVQESLLVLCMLLVPHIMTAGTQALKHVTSGQHL